MVHHLLNKNMSIILDGESNNVLLSSVYIGLDYNGIELLSNGKGGLLVTGKSNNNIIGNSFNEEKYNYICNKDNYAIKLKKNTFDNKVTYNFINVNILNNPTLNNGDIVNISHKNIVYNNNVPL